MKKEVEKIKTRQKQTASEVFLRVFVKELISTSHKENITPQVSQTSQEIPSEQTQIQSQTIQPQIPPFPMMPAFPSTQKIFPQTNFPQSTQFPLANAFQQPQKNSEFQPSPLVKVISFLRDPSVFSVECPGPEKNVLINRAGAIQTSSLTLKKEEIDEILNEISNKTRVPVITGVFRAAYENFIISAVVSEFVGTRFLMQKRMPLMNMRR